MKRKREQVEGRRRLFTWAGGGKHGHGVGVMVSPAIPLDELLLRLQDAKTCRQSGVEHILHSCKRKERQ